MKEIFEKNPSELLEKAIYNMLPKNKLRAERMKRLQINN
jgi:ribosomal protein L13